MHNVKKNYAWVKKTLQDRRIDVTPICAKAHGYGFRFQIATIL